MKLLRLELSAFGAFAERLDLDFTAIAPDALFLIHGPTGAGKTTILDAICFALYGETSAEGERKPGQLRSDHAAPATDTRASLDFELRGKHYRVERQPEFERAAKRGGGLTRQPAKAALFERQGETSVPLAARTQEVTHRIRELLGVDLRQFRQTALLPQGQFRRLLSAESKERRAIMASLFQLNALEELQDYLKERARAIKAEYDQLKALQLQLLEQQDSADRAAMYEARAAKEEALPDHVKAAQKAKEAYDHAAKSFQDAKAANAKLDELEKLLVAQDRHALKDEQIAQVSVEIDAAGRASACAGAVATHSAAQKAQVAARKQVKAANLRIEELAATARRLQEARANSVRAAAATRQKLDEACARANAAHDREHERVTVLEQAWRDGRASNLATTLVAGEPCPVCGSTEHPSPADRSGEAVRDDTVDKARNGLREMDHKRRLAQQELSSFDAFLQDQEIVLRRIDGEPPPYLAPDRFREGWKTLLRREAGQSEDLAAAQEALRKAQTDGQAADKMLAEADAALVETVVNAGFVDINAMMAARREARWLQEAQAKLTAHQQRRVELATRIEQAQSDAKGIEAKIDLEPLEAARSEAEAGIRRRSRRWLNWKSRSGN